MLSVWSLFKSDKRTDIQCSITMSNDGLWIICVKNAPDEKNKILHKEYCAFEEISEAKTILKGIVNRFNLMNAPCTWVLQPDDYQLLLIDNPRVEESEMFDSIKWQISEISEISADEALIDYFNLPAPNTEDSSKMLYVVMARKKFILSIASIIESSGLKLSVIDIAETSFRNILCKIDAVKNGIAFFDSNCRSNYFDYLP